MLGTSVVKDCVLYSVIKAPSGATPCKWAHRTSRFRMNFHFSGNGVLELGEQSAPNIICNWFWPIVVQGKIDDSLRGRWSMMKEQARYPSSRGGIARQVALGIVVGGAVTSLPWLVSKLNYEGLWPLNFLWFPGLIAAVALSGNVHTYSFTMALAVSLIFYASLTYLILRAREK